MDFTRNEYRILGIFYQNACFSKLCSFRITRIAESTNLSVPKIRQSMKMFINLGLIDKGARDERADTYFLTQEGIKVVEESQKIDSELLEKINKIKKGEI